MIDEDRMRRDVLLAQKAILDEKLVPVTKWFILHHIFNPAAEAQMLQALAWTQEKMKNR